MEKRKKKRRSRMFSVLIVACLFTVLSVQIVKAHKKYRSVVAEEKELEQQGWKSGSSGNASQFVYEETLVVYKDSAHKSAAQLLVSDLGQGRVVNSAARYSFSGDVLVVVGKNYKPY